MQDGLRPSLVAGGSPFRDSDERAMWLHERQPKGDPTVVAVIMPQVVSLITRVAFASIDSDSTMLSIAIRHAQWCVAQFGDYQPDRDLTESSLSDYRRLGLRGHPASTTNTYISFLRLLRRGERLQSDGTRTHSQAPYAPRVAARYWDLARTLDGRWGDPFRVLVSCSLGAGMQSKEINLARVDWIERQANRVIIQIPDHLGEVREVPVFGAYGRWLADWHKTHDPDDLLLRPEYKNRPNTISDLVRLVGKHQPVLADFKVIRARHTWIVDALTLGVPFHAVCQAAGVGRDSNLPTDLLPFMPITNPLEVHRAFDKARPKGRDEDAS